MATALVLSILAAPTLFAAARSLSERMSPDMVVVLDADQSIHLTVTPRRGDAWTRLALRLTGDASQWKAIARLNHMDSNLLRGIRIRVPYAMLTDNLQRKAVMTLFPDDHPGPGGWFHKVVAGTEYEGESLWRIAEWLSGDGANYAAIRAANPSHGLSTHRGETIFIPVSILSPGFASVVPSKTASSVQIAEDDPTSPSDADSGGRGDSATVAVSDQPANLEYHQDSDRPYAVYHLRKGEALYSSVAIRFTGRVYARDVNEVVDEIVKFNGIRDVSSLPVGFAVRIPMELLTAENRPPDDPARIAWERSKRESARLAKRVLAKDLQGVRVVIDPGHGGRDTGTIHHGLWESTYVYDVACRLKKILETRSGARVSMTTRSAKLGFRIPDRDVLPKLSDQVLLTTPRYNLDDPIVGVNLRWYLANAIYHDFIRKADAPEKIIFISIHADSLHPSLRGAMAYIPGEKFARGTYTKRGRIYLARSEVKRYPTVTLTKDDALEAEGLSRELASSIIHEFGDHDLEVHPFQPVRAHVVRNRREWVPAVIRYNRIPTRLLLEICNLGNKKDRKLVTTKKYRQQVAEATYDGIVDFFAHQQSAPGDATSVATASR